MDFEVLGDLSDVETLAAGHGVRDLPRLRRLYGRGRWRKMKAVLRAELHWYEAHGIGKKERKAKQYLD